MRTYEITITGTQPLLMRRDDIDWADRMEAWKIAPGNKRSGKAGDDRSPAWRWLGSLYHDGDYLVIPTENVMRALMEGAAGVLVPGAKGSKSFKAQSQSGIMPRVVGWPLLIDGSPVPVAPLLTGAETMDFEQHKALAERLGFRLFVKRARIGQSKHVRVRPRFDRWAARGELVVTDEQITAQVLADILDVAGKYKGLGDWRPSSKTPGTYGMFQAEIRQV